MAYGTLNAGAITPGSGNTLTVSETVAFTGTVSSGTLGSSVILTSFVGMIAPFAMTSPPTGWLASDGSAVSRTVTYSALFAALSTTWGVGDGSSTFNVPDLEGAFLRGVGTSTLFTQDATVTLAAAVDDQVQTHWHGLYGSTHALGSNYWMIVATGSGSTGSVGSGNSLYNSGANEGRMGTETRPNNIGVKYCIKY